MFLAAVHLHPAWSLGAAAMPCAWIVWYWMRLGRSTVPESRRTIRRLSLFLMVAAIFLFVRGLSFIDRSIQPREYIVNWMMALVLVVVVIAIAALDAMNTFRLLQRQSRDEVAESARELVNAIQKRRASRASSNHESSNGQEPRQ